jgi:hypothetical protein
MSIENTGVFRSNRFRNFLLHLQDLQSRVDQGGFEPADFIGDLRRIDAVPRNVIEIVSNDMNDAVGYAGRNSGAL